MRRGRPRRVAVVGIDGSGKSSAVARLRARGAPGVATLHAPEYHQQPDAPLQGLSRAMEAVSLACDELGLTSLKAAVLYLQMTMYGTVERALVDAFEPRLVVSDRHALVDTLAYGPIYRGLLGGEQPDSRGCEELLRLQLARASGDPLDAVIAWQRRHARRLGRTTELWDLSRDVVAALEGEPAVVLEEFAWRYGTELPDAVVLLDVDPDEALRRCAARGGCAPEMHETSLVLGRLREAYLAGLAALERARPEVRVHRVDANHLDVEEAVDAVLACAGTPVGQPLYA